MIESILVKFLILLSFVVSFCVRVDPKPTESAMCENIDSSEGDYRSGSTMVRLTPREYRNRLCLNRPEPVWCD